MNKLAAEVRSALISSLVVLLVGGLTAYFGLYKKVDRVEHVATLTNEQVGRIQACLDNTVLNVKAMVELSGKIYTKDQFLEEKERQLRLWENSLNQKAKKIEREGAVAKGWMHANLPVPQIRLLPDSEKTLEVSVAGTSDAGKLKVTLPNTGNYGGPEWMDYTGTMRQ